MYRSHNIRWRQGLFCEMVQKRNRRAASPKSAKPPVPAAPPLRSAAAGRAPTSLKSRWPARSTCSGRRFAATSLDDLSAATGMNRPSLYGAFGDKRELYIKSYESYRDRARAGWANFRAGPAAAADAAADLWHRARHVSVGQGRPARLLHGDDGDLGSGVRSRDPRPGRHRSHRDGPLLRPAVQDRKERGELPLPPIRTCWRNWRRRRSTPSPSAPAPRSRAPSSKRS